MVEEEQATFQRPYVNAGQENNRIGKLVMKFLVLAGRPHTHQGAPLTHFVQIDTVLGAGGGENRQSSQADSVGGFGGLTY